MGNGCALGTKDNPSGNFAQDMCWRGLEPNHFFCVEWISCVSFSAKRVEEKWKDRVEKLADETSSQIASDILCDYFTIFFIQ